MLVNKDPGLSTLFPNAGIADRGIDGRAVLHFRKSMHGNGRPGDVTAANGLEILVGRKGNRIDIGREEVVRAFAVFLPASIGKGC